MAPLYKLYTTSKKPECPNPLYKKSNSSQAYLQHNPKRPLKVRLERPSHPSPPQKPAHLPLSAQLQTRSKIIFELRQSSPERSLLSALFSLSHPLNSSAKRVVALARAPLGAESPTTRGAIATWAALLRPAQALHTAP